MKRLIFCFLFFFILGKTLFFAQNSGSLDLTFNTGTGTSSAVWSIASQADGKTLIVGAFLNYNGVSKRYIARINENGTLDTSFETGTSTNSQIYVIKLQTDGKILIAGTFSTFNGFNCNHIARLNNDGSYDTTFNIGSGANNNVSTIEIQSNGKILIGGSFTSFDGVTCNRIARLNTNGSLDSTFNSGGSGANGSIGSLALQLDGKIIIGGGFSNYNGVFRNYFARLNSNGTLDLSFVPNTSNLTDGYVGPFLELPNGKILACGTFNKKIKRFNQDGTEDFSFNPSGVGAAGDVPNIRDLALQADGRILISGYFSSYNGTSRKRIARLHSNGTLDVSFNPGGVYFSQVSSINTMNLQNNDKIVIGGLFTQYNGTTQNNFVRLNNCIGSYFVDNQTICSGSFTWINGVTYTTSNNSEFQTFSGGSSNGCDSIVYLNLVINQTMSSIDTQTRCEGDDFIWIDGNTYTSNNNSATHTYYGSASNGCDSVVILNLTFNQSSHNTFFQESCGSFLWHGNIYTSSNVYTYNYINNNGCESTDTLHLTLHENPIPSIIFSEGSVLSTQTFNTYQWLLNDININGATMQNYIATQNGNYSVYVVDNNGCDATSLDFTVSQVDVDEISDNSKKILIYPNPFNDILTIESNYFDLNFNLVNIFGVIVIENQFINTNKMTIDLEDLESGIYFLITEHELFKIIKK